MRTCEQRTEDVLARRDAYRKRQQRTQSIVALATLCGALVLSVCLSSFPFTKPAPETDIQSYAELFAIVKDQEHYYTLYGGTGDFIADGDVAVQNSATGNSAVRNEVATEVVDDSAEYSNTNLQVVGVDEADIVKTDGKYLYVLSGTRVVIVDPHNGTPQKLAEFSIPLPDGEVNDVAGMYLYENRLVLTQYRYTADRQSVSTIARIYDVSQPTKPMFVTLFEQDGGLLSSRMVGDMLYTVSHHVLEQTPVEDDPATYVPKTGCDGEAAVLPAEDIYICTESRSYIVVTATRVSGKGERVSQKAVMVSGDTVYANTKNLYVAGDTYLSQETPIVRFALNNGRIEKAAETTVSGDLLNQFSMDEHNGYLRVVLTARSETGKLTNSLLVLDSDLKTVGSLTDLAKDERVYSVRFAGDVGYFVTFRQVDPLFTVDLSDPRNPVIQSELKIPGFSQYLHPYGDGQLLGIGMQADENGRTTFMKLSMFNVSDPTAVTESHVHLLDQRYSDVLSNHKAALIDVEKNLIGFATADSTYHVYGYDPVNGFTRKARVAALSGGGVRGVYIGDYLYVISRNGILSYRLDTFESVGALSLVDAK